jgi:hypothetical protein
MIRAARTLAHVAGLALATCGLTLALVGFAATVAVGAPVALALIMGRI